MGGVEPLNIPGAEEVWPQAVCSTVDPELFFTEFRAAEAVAICQSCPVRQRCLEVFGPLMDYGVVGGTSPQERRAERRRKKTAA